MQKLYENSKIKYSEICIKEGNFMKMKKAIIRTLIVMMVAVWGLGSIIPSLATTVENKELSLSYFRYVNGASTNGYALNTVGNEGESHHPIF